MKATMEFSLPREGSELKQAMNGGLYKGVLDDLLNEVRSLLKYGEAGQTKVVDMDNADDALSWVRTRASELLYEAKEDSFDE